MCFGGGGDGGAGAARAEEAARQARISEGTAKINDLFNNQFNDDFYGQRQQSYLDYASPQLQDQYDKARQQLAYSLDRAGTSDSSIRAAKEAELQKLYDTNVRSLADTGLNYANDARNNVESARSSLISQLNATADQQGAINSATARAASLSAPAGYSPLGQMFSAFTSALGQQAANEQTAALTGQPSYYNTGLFSSNKNAVKTTS